MTDYEVEFPAETLLAWIREEHRTRGSLDLWPAREFAAVPRQRTDRGSFGDEDDLPETVSAGNLDVAPMGERDGWTLHFRIEDALAPHLPEDEAAPEGPEPIDFEAFWSDFVVPARGSMYVWVTADSADAKRAFDHFVRALEARHRAGR
jgi:hypothetical protein